MLVGDPGDPGKGEVTGDAGKLVGDPGSDLGAGSKRGRPRPTPASFLPRAGRTQLPSWFLASPHPPRLHDLRLHAPHPQRLASGAGSSWEHLPPSLGEADSSPLQTPGLDPCRTSPAPQTRDGELRWQRDRLGPRERRGQIVAQLTGSHRRECYPPCGPASRQSWVLIDRCRGHHYCHLLARYLTCRLSSDKVILMFRLVQSFLAQPQGKKASSGVTGPESPPLAFLSRLPPNPDVCVPQRHSAGGARGI